MWELSFEFVFRFKQNYNKKNPESFGILNNIIWLCRSVERLSSVETQVVKSDFLLDLLRVLNYLYVLPYQMNIKTLSLNEKREDKIKLSNVSYYVKVIVIIADLGWSIV